MQARNRSESDLEEFVMRLCYEVGCYYHKTQANYYSLKKYDTEQRGQMGVFGWVQELIRNKKYKISTYKILGDKAGVSHLANAVKENMHYSKRGIGLIYYVEKESVAEDFRNTVKALKAIMAIK